MKFCNQCGTRLEDDMMFCISCGAKQPELAAAAEAVITEATEEAAAVSEAAEAAVTEEAAAVSGVAEAAVEEVAAVGEAAEAAVTEEVTAAGEAAEAAVEEAAAVAPVIPAFEAASEKTNYPVNEGGPLSTTETKPKKSKKGLIIGLISAVVAVALIAAGILVFLMTRKETIDAKDIVKVIGYGPNGHGKVAVLIAEEKTMTKTFDLDDDVNPYPGLWSYLYNKVDKDEENYPKGLTSWAEKNESAYFAKESTWKKVKNSDKIDEAQDELLKLKVSVAKEDAEKDGTWSAGDKITIIVEGDEDDLKKAHIVLKNTKFEYTFQEDDFAECKAIDPFEGTKLVCSGKEGTPSVSFDKSGVPKEREGMFYYSLPYFSDAIVNGTKVEVTATPMGDLSQGYLKWNDRYYSVDEKALVKEFTVEGLEEATLLNPFEGMEVTYSGLSPKLSVRFKFNDVCRMYGSYEWNSTDTYKIGDTIEITYQVENENSLLMRGYRVDSENLKFTYTVPENAPHYVTEKEDFSKFSPAQVFPYDKEAQDCIGTENIIGHLSIGRTIESVDPVVYKAAKVIIGTDDEGNTTSVLWQLLELPLTADGEKMTFYYVCHASGFHVEEDGTFAVNSTVRAEVYDAKSGAQALQEYEKVTAGEGETCVNILE